MRDYFTVYQTDSEGNQIQNPEKLNSRQEILSYFSLRCPRMDLRRLRHLIELAFAAPNGPGVDCTHWEEIGGDRRMMFSARLLYHRQNAILNK